MASHPRSIHHLYDRYRNSPSMDSKGPALRNNRPQDVEDRHDDHSSPRGYWNDTENDWRRGGGKGQATSKPGFDFGGAWRQPGGTIRSAQGDPGVIRRPVGGPVTANVKQRRTGG
jgi:hypothetical protein